ncbi:TPA: hypothetical protein H1012_00415 [archaeon]|nr:hypothetical protein [Candidatus Naiadarchaeales archaeon SRR2090159.bin1288]
MGLGRIGIIAVFAVLLLAPAVIAAPQEVNVGTYVLNIGEYDVAKGSYKADFYLWFEWTGSKSPENFEIMNGRIEEKKLIYDETGYLFYRIHANLYDKVNVKDYPLDKQLISIKIENELLSADEMVYVPLDNDSGYSEDMDLSGWEISGAKSEVRNTYYKNFDDRYSRYTYSIELARPISAFYRMLIPILFIGLSTWLCFFIPLHKLDEKLILGGGTLISAIAFHIYLTDPLPSIGYLTLADKYMISLYALILPVLVSMIIVERLVVGQKHQAAEHINTTYAILSLFMPVVTFLVLNYLF